MNNAEFFLGFEENCEHQFDWEKDAQYDTYGLE